MLKLNRSCTEYDLLIEEKTGPTIDKLISDYTDMTAQLMRFSGYVYDESDAHSLLSHIYDNLFCEVIDS